MLLYLTFQSFFIYFYPFINQPFLPKQAKLKYPHVDTPHATLRVQTPLSHNITVCVINVISD